MKFEFTRRAKAQYEYWVEMDPKMIEKIHQLMQSIAKSPFKGIGKPEALRHELKGFWSRRITGEHRLVYKVSGQTRKDQKCVIIQCRYHY